MQGFLTREQAHAGDESNYIARSVDFSVCVLTEIGRKSINYDFEMALVKFGIEPKVLVIQFTEKIDITQSYMFF